MNENTTIRPLDEIKDDGSLACLGLDTDRERKVFSCPAARQIDLVGKTFWVLDYFGNIEGKDNYQGWLKSYDSKNLVKTINRKGNGKIIK